MRYSDRHPETSPQRSSKRDLWIAAALAVYYMLVMTAFTILRPARDALLLHHLGTEWYPFAVVITALFTGLMLWCARYAQRLCRGRDPICATILVLLVSLVVFRLALSSAGDWIYLSFYTFVQFFSLALLTQFRLIAGTQFTPGKAKRLYGVVCAGGTTGGILGPSAAVHVLRETATEDLLYVSAGVLGLVIPVLYLVKHLGNPIERIDSKANVRMPAWRMLRRSRHIKLIGTIICACTLAQTILDFQYKSIVNEMLVSADEKTEFFAGLGAAQNILALVLQLVVMRFVLVRFGTGPALLVLPAILTCGAVGIFLSPTLAVVGTLKVTEGGLRYSMHEVCTEILYLLLPVSVRSHVRPAIDMFGSRLFEGVGGLVILATTALAAFPIESLSLISLMVITFWFSAAIRVTREQPDQRLAEAFDRARRRAPSTAADQVTVEH